MGLEVWGGMSMHEEGELCLVWELGKSGRLSEEEGRGRVMVWYGVCKMVCIWRRSPALPFIHLYGMAWEGILKIASYDFTLGML